jgi:quinoprotein relay system zinc metallohydrolase 2
VGKEAIAVIDSGGTLEIGRALKKVIRDKSSLPIRFVINTHVHLDHIYGNAAFIDEDTEFIGHAELPKAMQFRKEFYERLNLKYLNLPVNETIQVPPSILINTGESQLFDLGDRQLKVTAYPIAHTNNDITIEDLKTRTLWAGDLLFIDRTPVIDGDINGFISTIDQLLLLDIQQVIPGHGTPTKKWKSAFLKLKKYFIVLRDDVRKAITNGQDLQATIDSAAQSEAENWELFEVQNGRNVNKIYPVFEWE